MGELAPRTRRRRRSAWRRIGRLLRALLEADPAVSPAAAQRLRDAGVTEVDVAGPETAPVKLSS